MHQMHQVLQMHQKEKITFFLFFRKACTMVRCAPKPQLAEIQGTGLKNTWCKLGASCTKCTRIEASE
jgi:hypothetical protein